MANKVSYIISSQSKRRLSVFLHTEPWLQAVLTKLSINVPWVNGNKFVQIIKDNALHQGK
jgi:hypothetical protein